MSTTSPRPSATASGLPPEQHRDAVCAALVDALADLRRRFHRALVIGGTDPDFADAACEKADAALALARGDAQTGTAP